MATAEEVQEGVYLHDGSRLAEMVGLDAKGKFLLEDCAANVLITVDRKTLIEEWEVVRRDA